MFKGNALKHKKGEPYLVDCNVTGSDVGSATKPCFPLLNLWKYTLVPAIAQLLAPGAPCEGAQVIVQQDNAGPHVEEVYSAWMLAMFESLGWMYEPQAPQGMSTELSQVQRDKRKLGTMCHALIAEHMFTPNLDVQPYG